MADSNESWNRYISDIYWPRNTTADAPEKILYFFIREALVKDSSMFRLKVSFDKKNDWFDSLINDVNFKTLDTSSVKKFKEYYTVTLQEKNHDSYGSSLPVPFHVTIPALFEPKTIDENKMGNRGFHNRFILTFFWNNNRLNYELIQKLWEVFNSKELNHYENLIVNSIEKKHFAAGTPVLKTEEELNNYIGRWDISKFACTHQPKLFQEDLSFILNLRSISRVEKIRWIEYLLYFHFSTYMLRAYSVIEDEFDNYDQRKDNCLNCRGIHTCVFNGKISVKSAISGFNKEGRIIQQQYHEIMNQTLMRGYVRFIVISRLFYIYSLTSKKEAESLLELKTYLEYEINREKFIDTLNKYLRDQVYINIEDFSAYDLGNITIKKDLSTKNIMDHMYNVYLDYYERKGIKTLENSTKGVFIKLAGDKMGCNYLHIQKNNNNFFQFNSEFLTFIVNVILGSSGKEQMLLTELWKKLEERGFSPSSNREKENIERQLSSLGILEKKSDAGESEFVKRTIK